MLLVLVVLLSSSICLGARYPLTYDPPRSCTGGPRRGVVALRNVLLRHHTWAHDSGIYNCRSVRGGSTLSEHGEGRAFDFGIRVGDGRAQAVADWLVAHAGDLGLQAVIFNRRVWGYGRWSWRSYSGVNPHVDHIHIGVNIRASNELTEAMVEQAFGGAGAAPVQPSQPIPAPVNPSKPSAGNCIRATTAVNVRRSPSTSASVMFVAFGGEQFTKISSSGSWHKVSNGRGSGYSYAPYWTSCGNSGRSTVEVESDADGGLPFRAAGDAPAFPEWAIGVVVGVGGTIIIAAIVVAVVVVVRRNRAARSGTQAPLMENKVGSAGSSTIIPQIRRRNSFGTL